MDTPKHTPAPWLDQSIDGTSPDCEIRGPANGYGGKRVATVHGGHSGRGSASGAANARLIAAAPDLLALAKAVEQYLDPQNEECASPAVLLDDARAAIAKAGGTVR